MDKRIDRFVTHGYTIILKVIEEAIGSLCTALLGSYYAIFALKIVVLLVAQKGADSFFSPRI